MRKVAFITTTSTNASKGAEALKFRGIKNELRKIQGGTASGCLFGIIVDEIDAENTRKVLSVANVRIIMEKVLTT